MGSSENVERTNTVLALLILLHVLLLPLLLLQQVVVHTRYHFRILRLIHLFSTPHRQVLLGVREARQLLLFCLLVLCVQLSLSFVCFVWPLEHYFTIFTSLSMRNWILIFLVNSLNKISCRPIPIKFDSSK